MQKQLKYILNGKEVKTREEFLNSTMQGEFITTLDGDTVSAVFIADFFAENSDNNRLLNERENLRKLANKIREKQSMTFLDEVVGEQSNKKFDLNSAINTMVGDLEGINKYPDYSKCQGACFCGGSCKKGLPKITELNDNPLKDNQYTFPEKLEFPNLEEKFEEAVDSAKRSDCFAGKKTNRFSKEQIDNSEKLQNILEYIEEVERGVKETEKNAYKETEGKLFYELDWKFITQMAERMASNKKEGKYNLFNWKKPMTPFGIDSLKQATMRHLIEVMQGNYEDDGREFGHIEAIADNMMMLNYQLKNK